MESRIEGPRPPVRVVLVVVLAYVVGVVDIVAGVVLIFLRYLPDVQRDGDQNLVTIWGAVMILAGLFVIAVASGLTRGRHDARVLATIAVGLSVLISVVDIFVAPTGLWWRLAVVVVAALVLIALWAGRSGAFFREAERRRRPGQE